MLIVFVIVETAPTYSYDSNVVTSVGRIYQIHIDTSLLYEKHE